MARILITGSADGLGLMAARLLIGDGHTVHLHGRTPQRADDALAAAPGAAGAVAGDLTTIAGMTSLADEIAAVEPDAVIHNAAIGYREPQRIATADGLSHVFAVNVLAPYVLTALAPAPRMVYLSSKLHRDGVVALDDLQWEQRTWDPRQAYSDSKLYDAMLSAAVARVRPGVLSNAVEPGWVPTKMGGPGAPDDLDLAPVTQAWLAAGDDPATHTTGGYFYHQRQAPTHPAVQDPDLQDALLSACAALSGLAI